MSRTYKDRPRRLWTKEQERKFWSRFWTQDFAESKALSGYDDMLADLALKEGMEENCK